MPEAELAELAADIKANGLRRAIITLEGQVLDGWHRYRACVVAGVNPRTTPFSGDDVAARALVVSENAYRRNLAPNERALAIVKVYAWAPSGRQTKNAEQPATNDELAAKSGVDKRTIQRAKKVVKAGLDGAVRAGKVSLNRAAEIADLPEDKREQALEQTPPPRAAAKPEKCQNCADLENRNADLAEMVDDASSEINAMMKVVDSDDKAKAALEELKQAQGVIKTLTQRLNDQAVQLADMTKAAKSWRKKFEALEKQVAKNASEPF